MESILKVVVTGEVDSGKSTLIGRLLYDTGSVYKESVEQVKRISQSLENNFEFAYLLDSLEEERKNQLTIDTTQAFCKTHKGRGFVFIDVPGHKQLVKNMLCGSSYADVAIVVIDAEKSIEEGTKRHIYVLKFLGIEKIIVVLNKMDLSNFRESIFIDAKRKITEFSMDIGIHLQQIIPVSAKQGENLVKKSPVMPWYKGPTFIDALNIISKGSKRKESQNFYFAVQDVYPTNGKKIYVGNIISGEIRKGECVKISPINKESRIKQIKVFNKNKIQAKAGESVGLVLEGEDNIQRGQIIYKDRAPEVTDQITARIFCVNSINMGKQLSLKCLTQQSPARIKQINSILDAAKLEIMEGGKTLKELDVAEVIIALEKAIALKRFHQLSVLGRFVLQDDKEICAVGIIP